jgi:beta-aspartyl-peptidase (threonine type)
MSKPLPREDSGRGRVGDGKQELRHFLSALAAASVQAQQHERQRTVTDSNLNPPETWALVIHGGAGIIERAGMTPERETAYRQGLREALEAGGDVLRREGSSLDAVETAIRLMEDNPLFNAGRGAVFTSAGRNELDAAIMNGATLEAGAVAGVTRTRYPITLARAVMEKSPHVMLTGEGADSFARTHGIEQVNAAFFFTERRWKDLERTLKESGEPVPLRPEGAPKPRNTASEEHAGTDCFGTVGAVALDVHGNAAAGTSTGGTTGKRWGRVGDSPIIGAGTYASNRSCAVSGTGAGEFFIRLTIAREVCALVEHRNYGIQKAADEVIHKQLAELKGAGGVIVVSPRGETAWSFNTSGMYRASISSVNRPTISIFKDEP